ncbi:MAG: CPBP family intramembrane metalloprotease [Nitrospirota bacterium]|nr:MAG: CPBP family intramembrane metalloprotease [Nitrospirota bacterium]
MMTPNSSQEHTTPLPDPPNQPPTVSIFFTVVSAIFLLAGIGMIVWTYSSLSPLDRVVAPERSLERLTSRTMELEHALTQVGQWEQLLFRILTGNEDVLMRAIMEYQELAEFSNDPLVDLYLAILEVEAGNREKVAKRINAWKNQLAPLPLFREFIHTAYYRDTISPSEVETLQAHLAEELPDNWFYGRLAIQIAKKGGDTSFELLTEQHLEDRGHQMLWSNRLLILIEVSGSLIGLLLILALIRKTVGRQSERVRINRGMLPPPWSGKDGFAVFVRGGAITTFLLFSLSFLELDGHAMVLVSLTILYGPILILTYFHLLLPKDVTVVHAFGLRVAPGRIHRILPVIFVLFAAGLIGDWMITVGVGSSHGSYHWTEWFDQSLVWGTPTDVAVTLVEYSIIAPMFEEVIFRGVLFATFRRRFGWGISAVFSALIFSLVHGYGLVGLLTVFWSGVLWAWAYEKTGSLWPGMIAHGVNNLLVSLTLVTLFR